jgi:hypothetical protein
MDAVMLDALTPGGPPLFLADRPVSIVDAWADAGALVETSPAPLGIWGVQGYDPAALNGNAWRAPGGIRR